jgi:hypothetical protein
MEVNSPRSRSARPSSNCARFHAKLVLAKVVPSEMRAPMLAELKQQAPRDA